MKSVLACLALLTIAAVILAFKGDVVPREPARARTWAVLSVSYVCPRWVTWTTSPAARPAAAAVGVCAPRPERAGAVDLDDAMAQAARLGQAAAPRIFDDKDLEVRIDWPSFPRVVR